MKVQVVLVVCFRFLQDTYGAAIQAQPQNQNTNAEFTTAATTVEPKITSTILPTLGVVNTAATIQGIVKTDSNKTISFPTVHDTVLDFGDPKAHARTIRNALITPTVDANAIIKVLAHKTRTERLKVAEEYEVLFKSQLIKDVEQKLSGWFKKLVIDLLIPIKEYYAKELHEAMHGAGTDEGALVEILSAMTNQGIREIKAIYEETYKSTLEYDIKCDTSGYFRDLLVALVNANRDESGKVDKSQAEADAKRLYDAGENLLGTDESTFITILTERSYKQLRLIFDEYQILTGHNLDKAIDSEFSGFIRRGLKAVVRANRDLPKYFAERLYKSMKGSGTNNEDLIRIVATRSEVDMDLIKTQYKLNYGISLEEAIADDTSGDYKTLLLELVKANPCQDGDLLRCPIITIRRDEINY